MSGWDVFVKGFAEFWNQPVPIIGFSVGAVVLGALSIIGKTAIGKKTLNSLKTGFDTAKNQFYEMLEKKDEIIRHIEEEKAVIKQEYEDYKVELKKQYEEKLVIVQSEKKNLEELVLNIADNIHNNKVKELVGEYVENGKTKVVEVSDIVKAQAEDKFNEIINEYKTELANLKSEIADLKHELEQEHNNINDVVDSVNNEINEVKEELETEVNDVIDDVIEDAHEIVDEVIEEVHEIKDEVIEDGKEITDTIKEEI